MKPSRWQTLWWEARNLLLVMLGTVIAAFSFSLFQLPYNIAAGGVSGIGIIVNHFTGFSVSAFYFIVNLPLLVLGFFYLGRWRFLINTVIAVLVFSGAIEFFGRLLPVYLTTYPLTDNLLLSAVYAGLVGGIGEGLVYAAGATMGGTGITGRILQIKTGIPLGQVYLISDGAIIALAGLVFGWEISLYALLTLLLAGLAADYALEGPSRARTAVITTTKPQEIIAAINQELGRGASYWEATGGYTGEPRTIIFCAIYRPQVNDLKRLVARIDPHAFLTIGITQQVIGAGFVRSIDS
jgi:uncharacterized membrane-anchored protein YitT (DUF2179 family)